MEENKGLEQQEAETKTYTQDEVNALLQSEVDRRITSALQKQAKKFEAQQSEAEKLRNMSESDKATYELQKRIEELEAENKSYAANASKTSVMETLAEKNLPVAFAEYLLADDAETMKANIETFEKEFNAAVNKAVTNQLAQSGGKGKGASSTGTGLTKEAFSKMSLAQQAELYRNNPTLYKEFTKR